MAHYRVYKLNLAGRIVTGEWIEAADESDACDKAKALCDRASGSVEIWDQAQRIAVLQCDG